MRGFSSSSHGAAIPTPEDAAMIPCDPALPAAAHLLGPGARPLLEAALAATGGRLVELRRAQVLYHPGRDLTVRYAASVAWPGDERPRREALMVGTSRHGPPPGTLPLEAGDLSVGVWRYPFDPALPGLAHAATAEGASRLAGRWLGGAARVRVRTYRPGRRAVVRATGADGGEVYLKVVPPAELGGLAARHRLLGGLVPVPEVLAVDEAHGVAVLRALHGEDLRERLRHGGRPLPGAAALVGLLDRLARAPLGAAPPARGPLASVARHAELLARVLPGEAGEVRRIADALLADTADEPVLPAVVHGDFHEAQLRSDGLEVVGLLDLEGVGPGDHLDDLATLLGHLATLAVGAGAARSGIEHYLEDLRRRFVTEAGPAELDRRVAAAILGLATGPFRVQEVAWPEATRDRLDLATRWLGRGRAGESALMAAS
ncbi:MAG: phosphotransferase [Acidimicrobiia bacterium]|nr:phosphotransferase [Acidimicrobiia bacterium]